MNSTPKPATNEATAAQKVPKLSAIPVYGNSTSLTSSCLATSLVGPGFSSRDTLAFSGVVLGEIFASLVVGLVASCFTFSVDFTSGFTSG